MGKVILGVVGGAIVAGGVVFFVMRGREPAQAPASTDMQAAPAGAQPAAQQPAPVTPQAEAQPAAAAQQAAPAPAPSPAAKSGKPSAAGVPAHAAKEPAAPPATPAVAENKPPAAEPSASPVPQTATPAAPAAAQRAEPPAPPPPPKPNVVTVPAGTLLPVRLAEALSSDKNQPGDTFTATLDQALVVDGFVIAERGARVEGRVVEAQKAGRVKGLASLAIQLVRLNTADGQKVAIVTQTFEKEGPKSAGSDAAKVGAAAGIGAAIGAIAGGGRGAAIGAGVGGAAGTGGVLATRGKAATLAVETRISFRLDQAVTITERLKGSPIH